MKMSLIYWFWIFIVVFLVGLIFISITTSFSVPDNVNRVEWLRNNKRKELGIIVVLCIILFLLTYLSYLVDGRIKFEAPFGQATVFLLAIAIILLSNFFITRDSISRHTYDAHPLLFHVTIFLIFLSVLTGIICSIKIFEQRV